MNHELMDNDDKQVLIFPEMLGFHKLVRLKRQHDQLTQPQLAKHLGMGISTLNEFEAGKKRCPFKSLAKMKHYLYHELYLDGILQTDEHYYG